MNDTFKKVLQNDINNTFFSETEFGDLHTINGKEMHVIFDSYELIKRYNENVKNSDGLYTNELLIFVPIAEYGARPKYGNMILLDGKRRYRVVKVDEEDGMYAITMEMNSI